MIKESSSQPERFKARISTGLVNPRKSLTQPAQSAAAQAIIISFFNYAG
jgi:hypothetical protein